MKNAVFWDVMTCGYCKNRRFEGEYRFHHQGDKNRGARNTVSSNCKPSTLRRNIVRKEELCWDTRVREVEGGGDCNSFEFFLPHRIPSRRASVASYC
jgi:hypothetical protein